MLSGLSAEYRMISIPPSGPCAEAAFVVLDELARGQAHNNTRVRTGYWRDIVVRKRKTELEYVTGEIVRGGVKHGVPTPICTLQMKMFDEIEGGRRPMQWENLQEDRKSTRLNSSHT